MFKFFKKKNQDDQAAHSHSDSCGHNHKHEHKHEHHAGCGHDHGHKAKSDKAVDSKTTNQATQAQSTSTESDQQAAPGLGQVKHVIAIASGKGGVGKSTVTTNLAVALYAQGFRVGLLDADLYGPSQTGLLGGQGTPKAHEGFMLPMDRHGIKFISMASLNVQGGAMVMRAPIAIKALSQFISGVRWGNLDYLLIDLPPGTGDIQLTLAQQARLSGAVIVTTPQKVASEIAKKGLEMFKTVNVPILGIIENMSGFTCGHCGTTTEVFRSGGGRELTKRLEVPFLGAIPLDPMVMMSGEEGTPLLADANAKNSKPAQAFVLAAKLINEQLASQQEQLLTTEPENIKVFQDTGRLVIDWKDGTQSSFDPYQLRLQCPCAHCVDENTGKRILDPQKIPLGIKIQGAKTVGRYGLAPQFSDGHNSGIFKFANLKEFAATQAMNAKVNSEKSAQPNGGELEV